MTRPIYQVALTAPADGDFLDIIAWSAATFGKAAADRYEALIGQALIDLSEILFVQGQSGAMTYRKACSPIIGIEPRAGGRRPREAPRHFVIYRVATARVDVLRILHDSRDLARHLPERPLMAEPTFVEMVRDIKARNAGTDPETLQAIIEEAVRSVRRGDKND